MSQAGRGRPPLAGRVTRRQALSGSLALLAALGAACTASEPPVPTPVPAPPTATPVPTPNLSATATIQTQRQTLRLPTTEPPTLDPALATDQASVLLVVQLFEGLTELDRDGLPAPLGAEKWEAADEGRTYTFTLRGDRAWSDGTPVTAADYEWAWRRAIDPRTASDYAALLYPIKNAARIHTERLDPQLLGVTARDDRTLVVRLEEPLAHFPVLTALWTYAPLRREVLEQHGDRWTRPENIVTNGPFRLVEWVHDRQLTLERATTYPGADRLMPRAVFRVFPSDAAAQVLAAYEAGELDVFGTGVSFEIPPDEVERIVGDAASRSTVRTTPQSGTLFLTVNHRRPHLQDPRVRRALGQVIERQRVLRDVLRRVGTPALGLVPDGIVGRDEAHWPAESVEEARRNLADAGFPDGKDFPPLTFTFNVSPQWSALGEYLRQRYRDTLGIELSLEPMEWSAYLRWRRDEGWPASGQLARGGWFSDYEDAYNWYNQIWDSREDPASTNAGWKHDAYDETVRTAAGTLDRVQRATLYEKADEILGAEYPAIPVFHYGSRTLVRPYVHGFEPERVLSLVRLKRVRLDVER